MAITPGIVSDYVVEVAEYGEGTPPDGTATTYTQVFGIQEFTPTSIEKNLEDDSDFDSGSWGSQVATGISYTATGTVKVPRATMTPDPGQEILRTAGKGVAEQGFVFFRVHKRGATTGQSGIADATFTEQGGSRTDLTTAEFTLTGRGELADYNITEPAA